MRAPVDLAEDLEWGLDAAWALYDHAPVVELTEERLARLRVAVLDGWRARASELGRPEPADMSGGCLFGSLAVKAVFGGTLAGNYGHQFNLVDGGVVDLSADAADVAALDEPHRHDPGQFLDNPTLYEQLESCAPRVRLWVESFLERESAHTPAAGPA